MNEKLTKRSTLTVYLIALAGQIAWAVENQFYNVFMYNEIAPVPFYIALMVMITAVTSTVTTIVMGAVSDVKGKRRVFMLYSFIFWTVTTAIFPFAALVKPVIIAVFIAILFDSIMTYFGATAYDASFNAYTVDITTLDNRGKVIGIVEIMTLVATLFIYGASGFIINAYGYYFFFILIGILVGVIGISGSFLAKDADSLIPLNMSIMKHIKSTFQKNTFKQNKNLFVLLTGMAVWSIGFNVFFPFIIIYLQHHIGLSLEIASLVIFLALLVSIILGIPIGNIIDRVGRKKIAIVSVILESISLFIFAFTQELLFLIIMGILWVLFMTMFRISSITWMKDLYPKEKYGQSSGYFLLFDVLIGMTIGPLIGGYIATRYGKPIVIDGVPGTIPPPLIFIVAAFIMIFSIIPLIRVKDLKVRNINKI